MYRILYRFLVPGCSAKPLVSAHDRIMGTHTPRALIPGKGGGLRLTPTWFLICAGLAAGNAERERRALSESASPSQIGAVCGSRRGDRWRRRTPTSLGKEAFLNHHDSGEARNLFRVVAEVDMTPRPSHHADAFNADCTAS